MLDQLESWICEQKPWDLLGWLCICTRLIKFRNYVLFELLGKYNVVEDDEWYRPEVCYEVTDDDLG